MGLGIGVNCKYCGEQLTVLDDIEKEKAETCTRCWEIREGVDICLKGGNR